MFLHANLLHIGGNMVFLAVFGARSRTRSVASASSPSTCWAGLPRSRSRSPSAPTRWHRRSAPRGAIAAVLGGYILLYPRARILTVVLLIFFFTLVELPAWAMIGLASPSTRCSARSAS